MASHPNHKVVAHASNIVKPKFRIIQMANGPPIIIFNEGEDIPECVTEIPIEGPSEPSTSNPTTSEPSTSKPSTSEPSTSKSSTSEPSTSEPSTSEPSTSEPSTSEPSTFSIKDFTIYKNRLESFDFNWKLDFIKPDQLAKAGFYFLGNRDCVRCAFCLKIFYDWQCDDEPILVHKNKSRGCPFFKKSQCYDVCGNFDLSMTNYSHFGEENDVYKVGTPNHQGFKTIEARLKSFDKCNKQLKLDIKTLCEAGFIYVGDGMNDQVECFYCSRCLIDFEGDDDPWIEHARFSPNCNFLIQSKGRDFVDAIHRLKNRENRQMASHPNHKVVAHASNIVKPKFRIIQMANGPPIIIFNEGEDIPECVTESPIEGPSEPSTSNPSTSEPSTSKPSTSEPSTSKSSTSEPSTSEPSTSEPSTSEPSTSKPSTSEPSTSKSSTSEPSTSEPSTSEPSTSEPSAFSIKDFTIYKNRLESFDFNWKLDFIQPDQLAKAGFYFLGNRDCVRCAFCLKIFYDWQCDDEPILVHKSKSRGCPFFKKSQCYDVCGNFDLSMTYNSHFGEENDVYKVGTPNHQGFKTIEARLKSFDKCNKQLKLDIKTLCEAGFFYVGDGMNDQVECFYCSRCLIDFEGDDDPWIEHARFSPNCNFLIQSKGRDFVDAIHRLKNRENRQMASPKKQKLRLMHVANCPPIIIFNEGEGIPECVTERLSEPSTSRPSTSEPSTFKPSTSKPSTFSIKDFTIYKNRLESFEFNWKLDFIKPDQLAKAGFYFLGNRDYVRCAFCFKEFDDWQRDDEPILVHKNKSRGCPFFKKSQCYDVCGNFDLSMTYNSHFVEENDVYKIGTPNHQRFKTFEARLKTFDKCNKQFKIDINILCEAGFIYVGDGMNDQVVCFYCLICLIDFEEDDDPWLEHARFSPDCIFVLLNKGRDFVDEVYRLKTRGNRQRPLKANADHEEGSILENNNILSKIQLTERKISSLSEYSVPDSLLCKICFKKKIEIAFIPCKHVLACIQCAMTIEFCAICRGAFKQAMKVDIYMDPEQKTGDQLQGSSSECSDNKSKNKIICKICRKEEMAVVFMPCKHIYACVKCTINIGECPICIKPIHFTIQVYL